MNWNSNCHACVNKFHWATNSNTPLCEPGPVLGRLELIEEQMGPAYTLHITNTMQCLIIKYYTSSTYCIFLDADMVTASIVYWCMQSPSIGIKLLCQISDTTAWPHRLNGVELIDNSPNDYGDFTEEEPGFEFQVHSRDLGLGDFFWSEYLFWCSLFSLIQSCIAHFSGAPKNAVWLWRSLMR